MCVYPALCLSPPVLSNSFLSGLVLNSIPWSLQLPPQQLFGAYFESDTLHKTLYVLNQSSIDVFILEDFPNKVEYDYIPSQRYCQQVPQSDNYSGLFQWVQYSSYFGKQVVSGMQVDTWNLTSGSFGLFLSVYNGLPIRLTSNVLNASPTSMTSLMEFYNYQPQEPPANYFDVPSYCHSGTVSLGNGVKSHTQQQAQDAIKIAQTSVKSLKSVKQVKPNLLS